MTKLISRIFEVETLEPYVESVHMKRRVGICQEGTLSLPSLAFVSLGIPGAQLRFCAAVLGAAYFILVLEITA